MKQSGNIRKMESSFRKVIQYQLPLGEEKVEMNPLLGRHIFMEYQGEINCIRCGKKTLKSFAQGYCYPCFTTAPETEECVLRPELCRAHEGIARDMEYASRHCLSEHVVYLSLTSDLKIGVTRLSQVPTRWIDQGAVRAIELARTPNRYTAGLIEVAMKVHMADKTNWRKMLSGTGPEGVDLAEEKNRIGKLVPDQLKQFLTPDAEIIELTYPVENYPEKIKSLNFDADPLVSGVLHGIKGQYLILDHNRVINMRKFAGYLISFRSD
jgi:hypothetical protein